MTVSIKKVLSWLFLVFVLPFVSIQTVSAAEVYFNKVYKGTGTYAAETTPISISAGTLVGGTAFRFQTLNPGDLSFSGENVSGYLKYNNALGVAISVRGVVSRPEKSGSTYRALYFYVSNASDVATGEAYLLVFPNFEDIFPGTGSISTLSESVEPILNNLLLNQIVVTCDASQKYDRIVSGFHQSIAQKSDGSFVVWGQAFANDGTSDVTSPIALNASNYPAMTGTPMKATIGGPGGVDTEQGILLTTAGLFAWGSEGGVLDVALTNNTTFQKIATPTGGDANTKLPTGVTPASVSVLFASYQTLVLVTTTGNVWVLTQASANLQGDASTLSSTTWHKVKTGVGVDLTGITAVRGQVSSGSLNGLMALSSTGQAYAWGSSIYLGNGTASTSKNYATLMTLPTEFSSSNVPKMIGVTGGINNASTTKNTFYILSNTGSLYALGANNLKQCGDFTTTENISWVNVKKNSTTAFSNVSTISVQEHDAWNPSVAAVTANGDLYTWGEQERSMLGQSPADGTFDPSMPGSFTSGTDNIALFAELGGHTLVYVKDGSSRFCYVGHKISGSMGDGTTTTADLATFNCTSTPIIDLCKATVVSATPTITTTGSLTAMTVCAGSSSATQSITVSGADLTANIILTAPTGYELSLSNNSGFGTTVTLNQVSGKVAATTVYVRLASSAINGASGNIVASSTGATDKTVATVAAVVNPIPSTPTINAGGVTTFCAGGSVVLTSSSATGNQWYKDGTAIGSATNRTYSATTSGAYTVIVTTSGCSSTASTGTTVTVNSAPSTPTINAGGVTTFCSGGSVVLTSSSATGNQWYKDGAAIGSATNQTYSATTAGVYTVIVTTSGCSSTASAGTTVVVNAIPSTPTISAGGATTFCTGGSVVLTSSSASGNQWYKDGVAIGSATNRTYSATTSGAYTVIVTTSGCSSMASAGTTVTVNAIPATPTISAGGSTTFCTGGSVVLTSSSATGNQWFKDGSSVSGANNQTYTATTAGAYTVIVTTSNCSSAASAGKTVVVNAIPATPTIGAGGPTVFCAGGNVVLTSSSATGNQWYKDGSSISGATNQTYTATTAGVYTVIVTTSGCSSMASAGTTVVVNTIPSTPTITAGGATTFCTGGSVVLTSSSATGNQWFKDGSSVSGANNQTYTATTAGVYTVIVTTSNCSSAASTGTTVTVSTTFSAPASITGKLMVGAGSSQTYTATAVTGATSYTWSTPTGWVGTSTTNSISLTAATTGGILSVVANSIGCSSPATSITLVIVADFDGDGLTDADDLDDDNDGILDSVENAACSPSAETCDTDGDGTPNKFDLDSDADGISDVYEANGIDVNKDGIADGSVDANGVPASANGGLTPPDTDMDGKKDSYDVDSDGDGIPDKEEGIKDTDGDGISDFRDVDSDGDGIPDDKEYGPTPGKPLDNDGDGFPDYLDLDSDNDGITDRSENGEGPAIIDTDGDKIPDYLDLDSDGDGLTDVLEADGTDADKDGRADGTPDSKGVVSSANGGLIAPDTDGDGKRDFQDVDSDADGIPDNNEGQGTFVIATGKDTDKDGIDDAYDKDNGGTPIVPVDTDNDGKYDFRDVDSDGDGILDKEEGLNDKDSDGIPDFRELDSDADGIPDDKEYGPTPGKPLDTDGDGIPDYLDIDSDNDGIPDAIEAGLDPKNPVDTDNDGTPDYRDLDSDNDGIPDAIEAGLDPKNPVDTDKDGTPDYRDLDSDNDGIPDAIEAGLDPKNPVDTDKDGTPDYRDLDSDNDGIPDSVEAGLDPKNPVDTDKDGTPDYRDLDSDNDGIPDAIEAGLDPKNPVDTDKDGIPDYRDFDSDNDGITDKSENGAGPAVIDTDGDKIPDYLDLDSDGDGLTDVLEADGTDADKDGRADGTPDSNGIVSSAKGGLISPDTDGDGKRDFLDVDSDADGIPDNNEAQGTFVKATGKDTDKDGIDDAYDKDNGGTPIVPVDTDKDGKPDFRDLDSDADGIPDTVEKGADGNNPVDTDKDGAPDYRDLDSDNDGIPDTVEKGADGNNPVDTDKDGAPDYRDLDSDNDGIPDAFEKGADGNNPVDTDKDGTPDFRDLDSDNDGIPDSVEAGPDPRNPLDSDKDGIFDFRELDSDNDGISDKIEAGLDPKNPVDTDRDGVPDYRELDSDNDGILDADEAGPDPTKPLDSDGDGIYDFREIDSNNDGIPDGETLLVYKSSISQSKVASDGSFELKFTITFKNARSEPLTSVQLQDDLTKAIPSPMQFTIVDFKTSGTLIKSTGYNGRTVIDMLAAGSTLAGKGIDSINLTIKVFANGYEGAISNIADGSAISKWGPVKRQSIDTGRSGGRLHGAGLSTRNLTPKIVLFIADVLTPNNDGINDQWIVLRPFTSKIDVTIFNRMGQIVYKKADYKNEWDGFGTGAFQGRSLPHGTYFYLIDISDKSTGVREFKKGALTLKRD